MFCIPLLFLVFGVISVSFYLAPLCCVCSIISSFVITSLVGDWRVVNRLPIYFGRGSFDHLIFFPVLEEYL